MRRILILLMVVALGAALAAPAEAQFARASVAGTVSDPDGEAMPGVAVTARNESSGLTRTAFTTQRGGYILQGLQPGTYTLTFALQGFQTIERPGTVLSVGQTVTLNISMVLSAVEETVTVTAETPLVETTSKEVGGALTVSDVENLPSINRSFIMFASLLPGVHSALGGTTTSADVMFVNGQDDTNNQFNIDGAANDDDFNGGNAGGQVRAAFEAMQEFQILTSQFDAEFGRTQGAVVNAVTKSGGNEFHGVGFFYAQDSDWNSTPFFVERAGDVNPEVTFRGFGGTVGGPIVRNRTHFFASYERLKPNEAVVNNFDAIGRSEQNFSTSEDNIVDNIVLKLDHQLTGSNKMSVRWLWEHSPQFRQGINSQASDPDFLGEEDDYDWSLVGSLDSVFTDTIFNNLRVSFVREDVSFSHKFFNECGKTFQCLRTAPPVENHPNIDEGASSRASSRINNSIQFDDTLSWYLPDARGDHDIRTGFHYSFRTVEPLSPGNANGTFDFPTNVKFDINDFSTYPENFDIRLFDALGAADENRAPDPHFIGLFFQDDWQPIPNLTLNLGARYDYESHTYDNDNIAPRLGVSWDPLGDGRTIVRAGYGRFYDRFITGVFDNFWRDSITQLVGTTDSWAGVPGGDDCVQCFVDLFQAQGFTNLSQARDFLAALLEASATASFNANPTVDHPDRVSPFADTISAGFEREIIDNVSFSFDYVRTHNKDIILRVILNDFDTATGTRPGISIVDGVVNTSLRDIATYINGGKQVNNSLQFQLRKRASMTRIGMLQGRMSYTWTRQRGNFINSNRGTTVNYVLPSQTGWNFDATTADYASGVFGTPIGEDIILDLDHPANSDRPTINDREHLFNLAGSWTVPGTSWRENGGLTFSGIFRYWSGQPFTIVDATARHPHTNTRLPAPAGTYNPNDPNDISLSGVESRGKVNGAREPGYKNMDFSVRYRVPFLERYSAQILVDVFNLFDTVNFTNAGSTRTDQSGFLIPTNAATMRQYQIGLRFNY